MARREEVSKKLACLNKRYRADIELYNTDDFHILLLEHEWYDVPGSSWTTSEKAGMSGEIFEKEIDSDYCFQMTNVIEVAKTVSEHYRDTVFDIGELPERVVDELAKALDELGDVMEHFDDKYLVSSGVT